MRLALIARELASCGFRTIVSASTRNRNRGGEVTLTFRTEAKKMLAKLEASIKPMIELNESFSVGRGEPKQDGEQGLEDVIVETKRGKFTFQADPKTEHLIVQSYLSGYNNYRFDPDSTQWLSTKEDQHDMRGA